VAVKIRLKRMGKIRQPYYRVVVVDARKKRDGRVIEEIGKYHPKEEPSFIEVTSERAQYWLGVGAQPSDAVAALLKVTGDWQKFKGLPGTEGTLRTKEPKRDKQELFNEALKDAANEPKGDAVTKKKATAKKMVQSETLDKTADAEKTEAPAAKAKTEAPAAKAKTEAPAPKAKTEAPAPKAKPEAPTADAKPEAPAAEPAPKVPAESKAEETPAESKAEETPVTAEATVEAEKPDVEKPDAETGA
jgi:small subunit ribosomal protein S16